MRKKRKKSDALDPFLGGMLSDPESVVRSSEFMLSQSDPNSVVRPGEAEGMYERIKRMGRSVDPSSVVRPSEVRPSEIDPRSAVRPGEMDFRSSELDPRSAVRPGEMNGGGGLFGMPPSVINEAMQKTTTPDHELVELEPKEIAMVNKVFRNNSSTTFDTKNPVTGVGVGYAGSMTEDENFGQRGRSERDWSYTSGTPDVGGWIADKFGGRTDQGKQDERDRVSRMNTPGFDDQGNPISGDGGGNGGNAGGGAPGGGVPSGVDTRQNVSRSGSSLDKPVEEFRDTLLDRGKTELEKEWTPYEGVRFQPKSADTTTAMNLVRTGVGAEKDAYGKAATGAAGEQAFKAREVTAGTAAPGMGAYERDWESKVIDPARKQAEFELSRQLGGIGAKEAAIAGGGRHSGAALERGAARAVSGMGLAQLTGQLSREGYKTALGASERDRDAALQANLSSQRADVAGAGVRVGASRAGADIAGQTQAGRYTDINALSGVGAAEEAYGQRDKDWAYDQTIAERDWDKSQTEWGANLLASAPTGQQGWSSSPQFRRNATKDRWGRALAGATVGSTFGPWGAVVGGGLGYMTG